MTTEVADPKKIVLTPAGFKYMMFLYDAGADSDFIPVGPEAESNIFTELQKKGVVERKNAKKGRGGSRGEVHILVDKDSITEGNGRAPRGSGGTQQARQTRGSQATMTMTEFNDLKKLLHDHDLIKKYLAEGHSRNMFDSRVNQPLGKDELMSIINGGGDIQAEVEKALRRKHLSYRDFLTEERGYPSLLVDLMGEPEPTTDRPDEKPTVQQAMSNGRMTPPKPMPKGTPSKATAKAK